ncbi:MAG: Coenzyme F420 hydrogenase/dehydrogenase, beta subunit C-terminal domain [Planctomycetota bacterium]
MSKSGRVSLSETVIPGGYCIGCGACQVAAPQQMSVVMNDLGMLQASGDDRGTSASGVCPFSNDAENEDALASEQFAELPTHARIGRHRATYAGHVVEDDYRDAGSSGGLGTWIVSELLRRKLVDGVVHVKERKPTPEDSRLFAYGISRDIDAVRRGAKSRYYPVEFAGVLNDLREENGRFVVVALPCFAKALRLLTRQDAELRERVRFVVALFCGHLKSTGFAGSLAWEAGVPPWEIDRFDFRHKLPDAPASAYGISVTSKSSSLPVVRPMKNMTARDWGLGLFKYKACEYCDDVVGETADVSVGDAWIKPYVRNPEGTNALIVRDETIASMVDEAMEQGRLSLDPISANQVAESQAAGLRHRREGLAFRLWLTDRAGVWRPRKRVEPAWRHLSRKYRRIFVSRMRLAELSHQAFEQALKRRDLSVFHRTMRRPIAKYRALYVPLWKRALRPLRRAIRVIRQ